MCNRNVQFRYQFIESWVVVVADHFRLPFGSTLGVRSQTCDDIGVRVGAVWLFLFDRRRVQHTRWSIFT